MSVEKLEKAIVMGETIAIEFKRCGGSIESDTYESVCSMLNRFGGDLYLGVEDNGTVKGVPEKATQDLIRNFISMVGNVDVISPTVYLTPEVLDYKGAKIIHIHIPPSSEVHSYKKVIYDRVGDSDVKVTATGQIAQMYIRKQKIFTEKKVYPHIKDEDLRLDMLPQLRQLAQVRNDKHPWVKLTDGELLQSAGLIGEDAETGKIGYNLAAIMLLGRDGVIFSIDPVYRTDALVRRVNTDRYDDRLLVQTNLIDSYDLLMGFAEKHLPDKFYLEDDIRISLRNKIAREMLVNTLMHREFTSTYIAKFVIESDRMYTENANRATTGKEITPDNLKPEPKNPVIAAFFRNIGMADELGSGTRNLYKYGRRYSGQDPQMIDGDVFRIIVPLDESYSFDARSKKAPNKAPKTENGALIEALIIKHLHDNPRMTQLEICTATGSTRRVVQKAFAALKEKGQLRREGSKMNGVWIVEVPENGDV